MAKTRAFKRTVKVEGEPVVSNLFKVYREYGLGRRVIEKRRATSYPAAGPTCFGSVS